MANIVKGILMTKIGDNLKEVWSKTGADNVIVDTSTGKTLATALSEIIADLASAVAGGLTQSQMETYVNEKLTNLVGTAPTTLDQLGEIADFIQENRNTINSLTTLLSGKVDKIEGKGLSANDLTDALLTKLNGITAEATKVEKSTTNGNIKINGTETPVYQHPDTEGYLHIPEGGTAGQVLRAKGNGQGEWANVIRSGASVPSDLAEGELFIQIIEE